MTVKYFIQENKDALFLTVVFLVSALIVWPFGNFPLNDDWSYSKSVVILTQQNKVDIGEWGAMTLFTHLLWGGLFVKLFGFSFVILRVSTLLSSYLGIIFLYRLIFLLTRHSQISLFGALCLLFYPLYFSLSNTFMTDVNFNTLFVIGSYFVTRFHLSRSSIYLLPIFLISVSLVLLRQFGILLPLSFVISCCFLKEQRVKSVLLSIVLSGLVYAIFLYYEMYLKDTITDGAAYKFSGAFNLTDPELYQSIISRFSIRWKMMVVHLSLFAFPILLALFFRMFPRMPKPISIIAFLISCTIAHSLFQDINPLQGNIFGNMYLGTETWFESLSDLPPEHAHTYSPAFQRLMEVLRFLSLATLFSCCFFMSYTLVVRKTLPAVIGPSFIFLLLFFIMYVGTLLLAESYFDRYHIPLITISLIVLSVLVNLLPGQIFAKPAALLILMINFFFSVAGTKDYFTLNETRWKAYLDLRDGKGIDGGTVNAGFEVNCWNDGKPGWWTNMLVTEPYTYLIQYRPEKEFKTIATYPFYRIFPPTPDTVRVMKRINPE